VVGEIPIEVHGVGWVDQALVYYDGKVGFLAHGNQQPDQSHLITMDWSCEVIL
jgi:hypothetical protein